MFDPFLDLLCWPLCFSRVLRVSGCSLDCALPLVHLGTTSQHHVATTSCFESFSSVAVSRYRLLFLSTMKTFLMTPCPSKHEVVTVMEERDTLHFSQYTHGLKTPCTQPACRHFCNRVSREMERYVKVIAFMCSSVKVSSEADHASWRFSRERHQVRLDPDRSSEYATCRSERQA